MHSEVDGCAPRAASTPTQTAGSAPAVRRAVPEAWYPRGYWLNAAALTGVAGSCISGTRLVPSVQRATLNEASPAGQGGSVISAAASASVGNKSTCSVYCSVTTPLSVSPGTRIIIGARVANSATAAVTR